MTDGRNVIRIVSDYGILWYTEATERNSVDRQPNIFLELCASSPAKSTIFPPSYLTIYIRRNADSESQFIIFVGDKRLGLSTYAYARRGAGEYHSRLSERNSSAANPNAHGTYLHELTIAVLLDLQVPKCYSVTYVLAILIWFHLIYLDTQSCWYWRASSSGIWRHVVCWVSTDVSEEHIASIFRVEEIILARNRQARRDMTPCSPLSVNRRFAGTYRLHLQGRRNNFS
jgi:hypothetical protein